MPRWILYHVCVGAVASALLALAWEPSTAAEEKAAPLELRYKATAGDRLRYRIRSELTQHERVFDMDIENEFDQDLLTERVFEGLDPDGNLLVTMHNKQLAAHGGIQPLGTFEYNSTTHPAVPETSLLGTALIPALEKLATAQIGLTLTSQGELRQVKGYAEAIGKFIKGNPIAQQFLAGGTNEGAKVLLQSHTLELPRQPVQRGDQWQVERDVRLERVGRVTGTLSMTYAGLSRENGRELAQVLLVADFRVRVDFEQQGAHIQGQLKTKSSSGRAYFDPRAGRLISLNHRVTVAGPLQLAVNGQELAVDFEQSQSTLVELQEGEAPGAVPATRE